MKQQHFIEGCSSLMVIILLCSTFLGCASQERVTRREVTRAGEGWVENESIVQERSGPCRKRRVEKEYSGEKVTCVNRKGQKIKAATPEACFQLGGKVIDEVVEQRSVMERK